MILLSVRNDLQRVISNQNISLLGEKLVHSREICLGTWDNTLRSMHSFNDPIANGPA